MTVRDKDRIRRGHNDQLRRGHQCSETPLTGESLFHIITSETAYDCSEIAGSPLLHPLDQSSDIVLGNHKEQVRVPPFDLARGSFCSVFVIFFFSGHFQNSFYRRLTFTPLQLRVLQNELKSALAVMEKYTE